MQQRLIHKSMLSSARLHPDNIAIKYHHKSQTYRELALSSACIASCLDKFDTKKSDYIALYMDKSIETIQSIYAILRSGSTYVPLDIQNPVSHLQYIVKQCDIQTFVTTADHIEKLITILSEWNKYAKIIVLADQPFSLSSNGFLIEVIDPYLASSEKFGSYQDKAVEPGDLAAILYTSGSTGKPKGVMISHSCVTIFCNWVIDYFEIQPSDNCISHAPLHFDLSLLDIFASHSAAAEVVLVPLSMSGNPRFLSKLIAEEKITIWQSVPSVLVLLLKYGDIAKYDFSHLRHVLFAGEVMRPENLKQLSNYFNQAVFHNIYGCTETNDTFIYSLTATTDIYPDPLPIGKPLPYVDFKIVRVDQSINPDHQEGELYVKTPTTMVGYKKPGNRQHSVTSSQITDDGLNDYYKTGDIVRLLPDNNLAFCGRADDIIKTNGYRVNILEIENTLKEHKDICEVAVIPLPDDEIGRRILAVIKVIETNILSMLDLKIYCAERLPKYAIPHLFEISTNPLPKTSSGKTNKQTIIQSRSRHVS